MLCLLRGDEGPPFSMSTSMLRPATTGVRHWLAKLQQSAERFDEKPQDLLQGYRNSLGLSKPATTLIDQGKGAPFYSRFDTIILARAVFSRDQHWRLFRLPEILSADYGHGFDQLLTCPITLQESSRLGLSRWKRDPVGHQNRHESCRQGREEARRPHEGRTFFANPLPNMLSKSSIHLDRHSGCAA